MQEPDNFAAELSAGMVDVGTIRCEWRGSDATLFIDAQDFSGARREFRFAESLREIESAITIDEATWRSIWADRSLKAASIAMFSVHVQEAVATAPAGASVLRLVPGGVIGSQR
ncbi:hypothetical protein QFZ23_002544 [Arthrobacter globiformis]|uniref:hypothetical protein n=1 Tax=Arthrobacter globiformis TaxID=1665 RepID=UPI0027842F76|nr:hypothetical protein [Arthrobacter globiformis]MDQ1058643.1 hypothetical protein [Arthrobacter globiformis]